MEIPCYPEFAPVELSFKQALHPRLSLTPNGVSEYTFANLYLFRNRYNYRISRIPGGGLVISGEDEGKTFFMTPCAVPERDILSELFKNYDRWQGIPEAILQSRREELEQWGVVIAEDRDNFDYLYLRTDLAELSGKKYHKKRNLVNAFTAAYPNRREEPLTPEHLPDALAVLDTWREDKGAEGDYASCREALELVKVLKLRGTISYVDQRPVGWRLGESLAKGRMFAIHFEKGIDAYKGIYQYMNQTLAASLPRYYTYINMEQDLGDAGLRQAKMTYRPVDFVKKYQGRMG